LQAFGEAIGTAGTHALIVASTIASIVILKVSSLYNIGHGKYKELLPI
jgi:hypothetical protein